MRRLLAAIFVASVTSALFAACQKSDTPIVGSPEEKARKPRTRGDDDVPVAKVKTPEKHRAKGEPCAREITRETHGPRMRVPDGPPCKTNSDCKQEANGRCGASGFCSYDKCYADTDCGKGGVCVCEEEGRNGYYCKMGDCAVDGDCGTNQFCSPTPGLSCGYFGGIVGWYCHTKTDECLDDKDCKSGPGGDANGYCAFNSEVKKWVCGYGHCVG